MWFEASSLTVGMVGVGTGTAITTVATADQGILSSPNGIVDSSGQNSAYSLAQSPPPEPPPIMTGQLFAPKTRGKDSEEVVYRMTMEMTAHLHPDRLREELKRHLHGKKMVCFGEEHDGNRDPSFAEVLDYEEVILWAHHSLKSRTFSSNFAELLKDNFNLLEREMGPEKLRKFILFAAKLFTVTPEELMHQRASASRIFALVVLPLCKELGYTDVLVEGALDSRLERSKDRIGTLVTLLMALMLGLRIENAYAEDFLNPGGAIANAFRDKLRAIFENTPDARVVTYGGALHSMTIPLEGTYHFLPGLTMDLSKLSFVPEFQKRFGGDFLSIDLVMPTSSDPRIESHFSLLKQQGNAESITVVKHSRGQVAFVFPG